MHRSLPGQQAGASPVYQHTGVGLSGRTQNAGAEVRAGGTDYEGDRQLAPSAIILCAAIRKDGDACVAKPVGDREYCIGHLSRGSEESN